ERVDDLALLAEVGPHAFAIALAGGKPHVVADLVEHAGRPVALVAPFRIDARRVDDALPGLREGLVGARQRRMMRRSDAENLAHPCLPRCPNAIPYSIADRPRARSGFSRGLNNGFRPRSFRRAQ